MGRDCYFDGLPLIDFDKVVLAYWDDFIVGFRYLSLILVKLAWLSCDFFIFNIKIIRITMYNHQT